MKEAKSFISGLFKKKTMLICIFFAFLISIYPIVRVNYNYIDDLSRVMYGYKGGKILAGIHLISCPELFMQIHIYLMFRH